uniref:Uncharacterized protein n=1 Tax=Rhizophora mucronata TaxID=61149 RepID=A0A2P2LD23_RHIMU
MRYDTPGCSLAASAVKVGISFQTTHVVEYSYEQQKNYEATNQINRPSYY